MALVTPTDAAKFIALRGGLRFESKRERQRERERKGKVGLF
jgi:hypothetical protein